MCCTIAGALYQLNFVKGDPMPDPQAWTDLKDQVKYARMCIWPVLDPLAIRVSMLVELGAQAAIAADDGPTDTFLNALNAWALTAPASVQKQSCAGIEREWPTVDVLDDQGHPAYTLVELQSVGVATWWGALGPHPQIAAHSPAATVRLPSGFHESERVLLAVARLPFLLASPRGTPSPNAKLVFFQAFARASTLFAHEALQRLRRMLMGKPPDLTRTRPESTSAGGQGPGRPANTTTQADVTDLGYLALESQYLLEAIVQHGGLRTDEQRGSLEAALQRAATVAREHAVLGVGTSTHHEGFQDGAVTITCATVQWDADQLAFAYQVRLQTPNPGGGAYYALLEGRLGQDQVRRIHHAVRSLVLPDVRPAAPTPWTTLLAETEDHSEPRELSALAVRVLQEAALIHHNGDIAEAFDGDASRESLGKLVLATVEALRAAVVVGVAGGEGTNPWLTVEGDYSTEVGPMMTIKVDLPGAASQHLRAIARASIGYDQLVNAVRHYGEFVALTRAGAAADSVR